VLIASPFCSLRRHRERAAHPLFEMATRTHLCRPGATYLDMPDDIIRANATSTKPSRSNA